jgi:hypothetical protein
MIRQKSSVCSKSIRHFAGLSARSLIGACALGIGLTCSGQTFTTIALPDLGSDEVHGGALNYAITPGGALVYGNDASLYEQSAFGSATITAFATSPDVDPSFLTVLSPTLAVVGTGEFGNTPLLTFNPANLSTSYTSLTSLQNFAGVAASATSLYVVGTNGTGGSNAVSYVTTSGAQQLLIDQAGTYSAGMAVDSQGDVYVADNDNDSVYEFTSSQLQASINAHTTLTPANGTLVQTFSAGVSSIAVDASGVLYAAGFDDNFNGLISYYNPATGATGTLNPEAGGEVTGNDPDYTLQAFSVGGANYISYVWQAGFDAGDQVVYGYTAVPEPAAFGWLAALAGMAAVCGRRSHPRG